MIPTGPLGHPAPTPVVMVNRSAGHGWAILTSGHSRRQIRASRSQLKRSLCDLVRSIRIQSCFTWYAKVPRLRELVGTA